MDSNIIRKKVYARNTVTTDKGLMTVRTAVAVAEVDKNNPGTIRFGWSQCNPNDNFSKKIGSDIAIGRLESTKPNILNSSNTESLMESINSLSEQYTVLRPETLAIIFDAANLAISASTR